MARPARRMPRIGVIGEGVCSKRAAALAERAGRAIARAGALLLCGGLGGVMEAASRGAADAGGLVIGVLPGFAPGDANRWVTLPIVTGMDQARNVILVRSCHAIVAIGGMYGTLSEIALALKLGIPVVGLGTWRLRQPQGRRVPLTAALTPEDAVARALRAARRRQRATRRWLA
ncbi:MAG TPA: TIGR00725 family protein [Methylomirabilota bacterium]|nr:TIGR00725 family protein [Methylomirabilota bacterium]